MSKRYENNLDDLTYRYHDQKGAKIASVTLRRMILDREESQISILLRDYKTPGPDGRRGIHDQDEIMLRGNVDELLEFYGIIELACIVNYLPEVLPMRFSEEARLILSNEHVRRYYE